MIASLLDFNLFEAEEARVLSFNLLDNVKGLFMNYNLLSITKLKGICLIAKRISS